MGRPSQLLFLFFIVVLINIVDRCNGALLPLPMHLLRPQTGCHGHKIDGVSCLSWRFAVETNNLRNWKTVPAECEDYVGNYMLGHLYRQDSKAVTDQAILYAKSLNLTGDGKETWVFDVDETVLSNLPHYSQHGFGAKPYDSVAFNAWVETGKAPRLPESHNLYVTLRSLKIKVVFLTGRPESQREVSEANLRRAGYNKWEKLILRGEKDVGKLAVVYKSEKRRELEKQGYKIIGNIGDQWSDILGNSTGSRTFKLPDPMYYLS
ncbi:hypothetical protein Scep_024612 [Stephania cephalantha]|uniref:Acid phosphatase n=1 Tax=Stephania cephalantha TaxID=152367 RepID=A0AAP0EZS0_9MAGN